jgi:hypothetical protein
MKNTTVAIVAIAAVAALLVASTTISTLTNQAFAGGHKRSGSSTHQTATQSCLNNANSNDENEANVSCQNGLSQLNGHDNAATVTPNQAPIQGD